MLDADGHYSAFVELADGRNDLVVRARAADGSRGRAGISVQLLPGGSTQALTPRLHARQNRLLEHQLASLKRRRLELELARDDEQLRQLVLDMEAVRAQQSRTLQIAVDE